MTNDICMAVSLWQAVFLGIVQGLTEFLPISSSAHLIVVPSLLGWQAQGLTFDVMLHVGTLVALLVSFRRQWVEIVRCFLGRLKRFSSRVHPSETKLADALILGTLPILVVGGLFEDLIRDSLRTPMIIPITLSLFALLLGWADRRSTQKRDLSRIRLRDGFIVGMAQALALVPGVSRSGVTITAALFLGLSRAESARFSFLLATPAVALAGASAIYDICQLSSALPQLGLILFLGVTSSFVSGFLCIKYFLRFLALHSYFPFVVYRLLLAAFIFVWLLS